MSWGSLGDLTFGLLGAPLSFEDKQEANLSEHEVINEKGHIQHLGPKLEEITLRIALHARTTEFSPETDLLLLKMAMDEGTVLDLVIGEEDSGLYAGQFLIQSIQHDRQEQWPNGKIRYAEATISLKEYVKPSDLVVSSRKTLAGLKTTKGKAAAASVQTSVQVETKTNSDDYSLAVPK